jgi:hypothetical protein
MIEIGDRCVRNCEGISRRRLLTVGGVGTLGLALDDTLRARAASAGVVSTDTREKSCIFIWLDGGPSQFETFDPKPDQPSDIRGPYGAIETNVKGIRISELLPHLAQQMDKYAVIRSFTHSFDLHSPKHVMTGSPNGNTSFGAVVSYMKGYKTTVPPFIRLGSQIAGVGGGRLGSVYDPVEVPDPGASKVVLPDFDLPSNVAAPRFDRRRRLLDAVDDWRKGVDADKLVADKDGSYQRALSILTSAEVRRAFDLKDEKDALREAYGANKYGQSCPMARRLVEAGTRYVEIKWFGDVDSSAYDSWDTHGADLPGLTRLETQLCPRFDYAMSALVNDLHERGLLDTTLVVAVGEFGRTPKINRLGGRDHWPACQSVFIAGCGIQGGTILGESDRQGAYPASRPVSLAEFVATLYRKLDLNANLDDRLRPFVGQGQPVAELL